jgi:hypothetical protein
MRRLLATGLFGYSAYWLWNATDSTDNYVALGLMALAVLIEFSGN